MHTEGLPEALRFGRHIVAPYLGCDNHFTRADKVREGQLDNAVIHYWAGVKSFEGGTHRSASEEPNLKFISPFTCTLESVGPRWPGFVNTSYPGCMRS